MTSIPRPSKLCLQPGCPELAGRGAYCLTHTQERAREHNAERTNTYHSAEWRRARRIARDRQRGCRLAHIGGCRGRLDVHHHDGDNTNHHQENLDVLCNTHHMRLEREPIDGPLHRALNAAREALRC